MKIYIPWIEYGDARGETSTHYGEKHLHKHKAALDLKIALEVAKSYHEVIVLHSGIKEEEVIE